VTVAELLAGESVSLSPTLATSTPRKLRIDSRQVTPGDLFFALRGSGREGVAYGPSALAAGALAVVAESGAGVPSDELPAERVIVVDDVRRVLALCASRLFDHPDRHLLLLGVSGTNGKTTTALLLQSVLAASFGRAGFIGTLGYGFGSELRASGATTPEAPELYAALAEMTALGFRGCAMEVSSHALAQQRVAYLRFAAAGFSNLTRDHLDFHQDMEAYYQAKRRLFFENLRTGATSVVNVEDPAGARLLGELRREGRSAWSVGSSRDSDVASVRRELSLHATVLELRTPVGTLRVRSSLIGAHNADNLALAAGVALAAGLDIDAVSRGLSALSQVPGRLERVGSPHGFGRRLAFVDYAHTDDALIRVMGSLRSLGAERLILVFGCGGDRDRGKRRLMGSAAGRGADLCIVTSDNPRSESPLAIINDIEPGLREAGMASLSDGEAAEGRRGYLIEPDRAAAIRRAVALARPDEVILVAGKGHETTQEIAGQRLPFDDRIELRRALEELAA
jgi:UDP-N-acetylmuramoyl-L-alanyl-D-glutamate--2,6-diaminopimelate ligase